MRVLRGSDVNKIRIEDWIEGLHKVESLSRSDVSRVGPNTEWKRRGEYI